MKKILCIILSTVLIATASLNVWAVSDNTVDTITDLGIMIGDENGNLNLDENVTRAEFTTIVLRMLGLADSGSNAVTSFADVPATHWASGAINLAAQLKIVNGYGDGNFGPEDTVTYEQATKMIVAALGYTPMAESNGGYPGGYQVVASQKGLFSGVTGISMVAPAVRGDIATMVVNALTVPLMEQTGYGTETKFETVSTHLLDKLGITKYEGKVVATSASSDTTKDGKVKLSFDYAISAVAGKPNAVKVPMGGVEKTVIATDTVETAAKELLDIASILYVKDADTEDAELICIVKDGNKNATVTFMSEDIKDYSASTLKVYTDIDEGEYEEYELNINKIYVNGRVDLFATIDTYLDNTKSYDITLMSQEEDEYNVAYITSYIDVKADRISSRTYKVSYTDLNDGSTNTVILDEEDKNADFEIYKNGKIVSFDEINENDVLSIAGGIDGDKKLQYGKVFIISDRVEGKVTAKSTNKIAVDGVIYKTNGLTVSLGDTAVFYKNYRGIIVDMDTTASAANINYGFATYVFDYDVDYMKPAFIRVLKANGVWESIELADRIVIDNGVREYVKDIDWSNDYTLISGSTMKYGINNIIAYDLNSDGQIYKLYLNDVNDIFVKENDTTGSMTYDADTVMFGDIFMDKNTVIYSIKDASDIDTNADIDEKDITVVSVGSIVDNDTHSIIAGYNYNDDGIIGLIIGENIVSGIDYTNNFFVVSETPMYTMNALGEEGILITGLVKGKETTIFINTEDDSNDITHSFEKGDVILYTLNTKNEVSDIEVLVDASTVIFGATPTVTTKTVGNTTYRFVLGYVGEMLKNGNIVIDNDKTYAFANNVIGTIYDQFKADGKTSEAMTGDITADDNLTDDIIDGDMIYFVAQGSRINEFVIISNDR